MITSIVQPDWLFDMNGSYPAPYRRIVTFFFKNKNGHSIFSIYFLGDSIRIVCGINAVVVIVVQSSVT